MNSNEDVKYRLDLAKGFLKEAEEDFHLKRWRSCVDSSQLAVENFGKAILMLFGISPKTHDPARHMAKLIKDTEVPEQIVSQLKEILPEFLMLGEEEHFLTDYGDESSYRLPWDIFDEDSAVTAINAARKCQKATEKVIHDVHEWRSVERT